MKFPDHIILDVNKPVATRTTQYWVITYLISLESNPNSFNDFLTHEKFLLKKENTMLSEIIKNQKKYTVRYNYSNPAIFLTRTEQLSYKYLFTTRVKVKKPLRLSTHLGKEIYDYLFKS
jgi:hypothetical protein